MKKRFFTGARLLAGWLALSSASDVAGAVIARVMLGKVAPMTTLELAATAVESCFQVSVAFGLWDRAVWAWRGAVGFACYSIAVGTLSVWLRPPPHTPLLLWGLGTLWHGAMLCALYSPGVRKDVFGEAGSSAKKRLAACAVLTATAVAAILVVVLRKKGLLG